MKVDINHITLYVSGYTETDPNRMLTPKHGRLSDANKVGFFRAESLARYLLQCTLDSSVVTMDKTYLIELGRDMLPLRDKRDKNYHIRCQAKTLG
jgi:hypothetical protein